MSGRSTGPVNRSARPEPRGGRGVCAPVRGTVSKAASGPRHGVARVLSKAGLCSRTEAARWVSEGRVTVDGRPVRDPEYPVQAGRHVVAVDGVPMKERARVFLVLNKPRGLVTTTTDEKGRDTVYRCLDDACLPWLAPVGRLDKASEGLLLFGNDPQWAAHITAHEGGVTKTYHVQVDALVDAARLDALRAGVEHDGERLQARSVQLLRSGQRNCWLEVVLEEGRNRHIRRLMEAHGLGVERLVRVAIGDLLLGDLAKGQWRILSVQEAAALGPVSSA
jgi:23S rRNA pseudouridine2605 synthase